LNKAPTEAASSSLLASNSHAAASFCSLFLMRPVLRSASASFSAAFPRHWAAVKFHGRIRPDVSGAVCSKQTTFK